MACCGSWVGGMEALRLMREGERCRVEEIGEGNREEGGAEGERGMGRQRREREEGGGEGDMERGGRGGERRGGEGERGKRCQYHSTTAAGHL